jgi:hypothetical protein
MLETIRKFKRRVRAATQFTSPYSIDECIDRLESKSGHYADTWVDVKTSWENSDTCYFHIDIEQRAYRSYVHIEATGSLERMEHETTYVSVLDTAGTITEGAIAVVAILLAGALIFRNNLPSDSGLILFLGVFVFLAIVAAGRDARGKRRLLIEMVEDALAGRKKRKHRPIQ